MSHCDTTKYGCASRTYILCFLTLTTTTSIYTVSYDFKTNSSFVLQVFGDTNTKGKHKIKNLGANYSFTGTSEAPDGQIQTRGQRKAGRAYTQHAHQQGQRANYVALPFFTLFFTYFLVIFTSTYRPLV